MQLQCPTTAFGPTPTHRIQRERCGRLQLEVAAEVYKVGSSLRTKTEGIVWAKVRLRGPLKLLLAFGKCFPE